MKFKLDDEAIIRVLYLTCTENIANYGIFNTQVKSLLQTIAQKYGNRITISLFSLMPFLRLLRFPTWRIEFVFQHNQHILQKLRMELAKAGIQATFRPLLSVYPFDVWRLLEMIVTLPGAVFLLIVHVRCNRINLLHCRSYHAGLLGLIVKKITGLSYIFDPRSLWVEEQVLKGKISKNSWSYVIWKKFEAAIISNAAACIVVSDPLKERFVAEAQRVEVIYTTAGEAHFNQSVERNRAKLTEESELNRLKHSGKCLLVFSTGSFNRWNNLEHLLARYKKLCQIVPNAALIIVTPTAREIIYRTAKANGIERSNLVIVSLTSDLVPLVLRQCDYSLLVMPNSAKMAGVMSVKFPEYLAAGLPVICDEYIGGAAHVIKQHQVGMLLSDDWHENKNALDHLQKNYTEISDRCHTVANSLFSVHVHAEKYAKLYEDIVTRDSIGASP